MLASKPTQAQKATTGHPPGHSPMSLTVAFLALIRNMAGFLDRLIHRPILCANHALRASFGVRCLALQK